jgi:hypothetical protein
LSDNALNNRKNRSERKAAGLCIDCDTPPLFDRPYCERHRAIRNAASQRYRAKRYSEKHSQPYISDGWVPARPHPPRHELAGQRFGRLVVISRTLNNKHNQTGWLCKCDCGKLHTVLTAMLLNGHVKSCGCLQGVHATHRQTKTPTYRCWHGIIQRCSNPNSSAFKYYGGRGITVCGRWRQFTEFFADMGERPPGMSIERIDNDKGYSPENCTWATPTEQAANRRCTVFLEHDGIRKPLTEWAKELDVSANTLHGRLLRGWPISRVVTTRRIAPTGRRPRVA